MATILDGKKIADRIRAEVKEQVAELRQSGIQPKLAVVLVGDDPASVVYARAKERACSKLGIDYQLFHLPDTVLETQLQEHITRLNEDPSVHGLMLELPLPAGINKQKVLEEIAPLKDVDGVHPLNRGLLLANGSGLFPVTPQSCVEMILESGIDIAGKHAVLVGRGDTVGKPLIFMMLNQNATITVCHSKSGDLKNYTGQADILIVAVGRAKMVTADFIKPGAVVIDAGMNETAAGLCGDVDFEQVQRIAGAISPVPGGVGSLTTVLLQRNLVRAVKLQLSAGKLEGRTKGGRL